MDARRVALVFGVLAVVLGTIGAWLVWDRMDRLRAERDRAIAAQERVDDRWREIAGAAVFGEGPSAFELIETARTTTAPGARTEALGSLEARLEALASEIIEDQPFVAPEEAQGWVDLAASVVTVIGSIASTLIAVMMFLRGQAQQRLQTEKLALELAALRRDMAEGRNA